MRQPTFLLKPSAYKTNKLYAILPDDGNGDMSVSGYVGNGTRVNPEGLIEAVATDTPRIDHYGKCGLLLEDTRINQAEYSEDASNWVAVAGVAVTVNDSVSPDGSKTADLITDDSTASESVRNDVTVTDATAMHTVSVFIKHKSASEVEFWISSDGGSQHSIRVHDDGTSAIFLDFGDLITDFGVERYKDGWFRAWMVYDMDDADAVLNVGVGAEGEQEFGTCWVWGMQVEEGEFVTSYIPNTSTGTTTRTADSVTISTLLSNELIEANNFAFFIDIGIDPIIRDGFSYNIRLGGTNGEIYLAGGIDGVDTVMLGMTGTDTVTILPDESTTKRSRWLVNAFGDTADIWLNGTKVTSDTGKDFILTSGTLTMQGLAMRIKIYEVTLFNKCLTDGESKRITQ